ncbi:prolyl-tRNA synthetase associated domain-containing protein [Hellea balneolensis]|uniref:prolyl-tRNA synthetase associated domain-containing protein n=1 Tax=Hellea balneolensis TaxID=287478 RepID=UPI0004001538|nr:prolyl-tRNA synthetase associated domain-containing protein [Hellea balneolensis]
MPVSRKKLFEYLDELNIPRTTIDHAPVFTVEESAEIKADMPGAHTKNLFLKDKAGRFFLICAQSDTQIRVNKLHPLLGCKRLSFGKPEPLLDLLGVTPGSVTLFSVLNDTDNLVTLILDASLLEHDIVNFHPLLNDATTAISSEDMMVFAKATGHDPIIMDFAELNEKD